MSQPKDVLTSLTARLEKHGGVWTIDTPPIRTLAFDAMHTLFEAKGSRGEMNARVFAEELARTTGAPHRIDHEELAARTKTERAKHNRQDLGEALYWERINAALVRSYVPALEKQTAVEIARRIHERILSDPSLYEVKPDMRELLRWIKRRRLRTVIASNQSFDNVWTLVRRFRLEAYFPRHWIFTSDLMGAHKPQPAFFERLAILVELTSAWEAMLEVAETYAFWAKSPVHREALDNLGLGAEEPLRACLDRLSKQGHERIFRERFEIANSP